MEKSCVITGGTSGIGKCTAEAMVKKGYTVYDPILCTIALEDQNWMS